MVISQHLRQRAALYSGISLINLAALLGLTSSAWVLSQIVTPQVAQAETARISVSVNHAPGESYTTLVRRAEATARMLTQRNFDSNPAITDVSFMMMGESGGAVAPLFTMEVSRDEWRSRPDPQRWATYFTTAEELLGLDNTTGGEQPASAIAAPSPIPAQPANVPQPLPATAPQSPVAVPQPAGATGPSQPSQAAPETVTSPNPVQINLPAAPSGQLGLPRSILR